jgi:hypothetical protein
MNISGSDKISIILGVCLCVSSALAETTPTLGDGSAVSLIARQATFDGLTYLHNGTSLSDYTEHQLFIGTSGDSWVGAGPTSPPFFNPFHLGLDPATQAFYFPYEGSTEWTVIRATDSRLIFGLEFLYGNGWTTGDIYGVPWGNSTAFLEWKTFRQGALVSTGVQGLNQMLMVGTVVGFCDPDGFDQLQVRCRIANSFDPNLQALALDDLKVQFVSTRLSGMINLEDFAVSPAGQVIEVDLLQNSEIVETQTTPLDAAGHFSIGTTKLGTTRIRVKASHWLARSLGEFNLAAIPINGLNASLPNGDVDGDNEVAIGDYAVLSAAFSSAPGDPNWAPEADLNGDDSVDIGDYAILSANFGLVGDN